MKRTVINRRNFLKLGSLGVALGSGAGPAIAAEEATASAGLAHRTLGRTGMKVTVVGVGAMRTSEPAVCRCSGRARWSPTSSRQLSAGRPDRRARNASGS